MVLHCKKYLYRISEFLRLSPHTHVRDFHFQYHVSLRNLSDRPLKFSLVFPVVQSYEFQKLLSDINFSQKPVVSPDSIYGNKFAVWQVSLDEGARQNFEESFDIRLFPSYSVQLNACGDEKNSKPSDTNLFTQSNRYLAGDQSEFKDMAHRILSKKLPIRTMARALYRLTNSFLTYKNPIPGLYTALEAYRNKNVDCGGFDTFFVSLCHAAHIPARIVSGFWIDSTSSIGNGSQRMHAWAEFMLPDGQWIPVDPSTEQLFDLHRTRRSGRFGFVGSDRVIFSKGCDIPLLVEGTEYRTDILQHPLVFGLQRPDDLDVILSCHSKKL